MVNFSDAYIERCDKETENMIKNETGAFLSQPLTYLKKNKNEFIYLESNWFEAIRVEAVSLEVDDVFGTYDVMLGLKLQKKFDKTLNEHLNTTLHGNEAKFDLIFSQDDGLWNLNFALNYVKGFKEDMTLNEAFQVIYQFLNNLVEAVKVGKS
ncbi:branched-chain amino acid aminotransferase [Neobacillus sp. PS2-9]|uniref:branched-chain amino acid aminotransferase n=1 Tax=Neobacillus sp. PS2-9 TaxID=3070676 RepID=UPI0027E053C4|nr:branched-chain amino acid aminotransferase [Neobacillus sp. PS2-9]WML60482.1 branched-chain amino acid aminotransferase [Neobacillus sp. PS2-9]